MRKFFLAALVAYLSVFQTDAYAADIRGNMAGSIYNRDDDYSTHDYSITRFKLKLDASDFAGEDTSFHFKGSTRSVGAADYNSAIPDQRIDKAYIQFNNLFSIVDTGLGRQLIKEIPSARVDGANLKINMGDGFGVGVFGGQSPDPYTDEFSGDYTTYGGYGFFKTPVAGASVGFVSNMYKGSEDVSFVSGSGYFTPSSVSRLYASGRSDHNIETGQYELTNLLVSLNYRPSRAARFTIAYNEYRAVKLYESMDYDINHDLQKTIRLSTNLRATSTTTIYGRFDTRTRESDNKSASLYMVGLRQTDILNWFFLDLSYRGINYFTSEITQFYTAVGADIDGSLRIEFSVTYMQNDQDAALNRLEQWIYTGSADWYITRQLYMSGRIEMSEEAYLDVESVYLEKQKNEFSSLTYFFYAGYRF
jgi:hypothetical protein